MENHTSKPKLPKRPAWMLDRVINPSNEHDNSGINPINSQQRPTPAPRQRPSTSVSKFLPNSVQYPNKTNKDHQVQSNQPLTDFENVRQQSIMSSKSDLQDFRRKIADLFLRNSTQDEYLDVLMLLLEHNCAFESKYTFLDIRALLHSNKQFGDLLKIPVAFGILEKYGANLLKPVDQRHPSWHTILFVSKAFQDKLKFLDGGIKILKGFGYKDETFINNTVTGLTFPPNTQPVRENVLTIVIDLIIAKFEVNFILTGEHPKFHDLGSDSTIVPDIYIQKGVQKRYSTPNENIYESIKSIQYYYSESSTNIELNKLPVEISDSPSNESIYKQSPKSSLEEALVMQDLSLEDNRYNSLGSSDNDFVYCSSCGVRCTTDACFCHKCGKKLNKIVESKPQEEDAQHSSAGSGEWKCIHCTFANSYETNVCQICYRTSWAHQNNPNLDEKQKEKTVNERKLLDEKPQLHLPLKNQLKEKVVQNILESPYDQKDLESFVLIDLKNQQNRCTDSINGSSMNTTRMHSNEKQSPVEYAHLDRASMFKTSPSMCNGPDPASMFKITSSMHASWDRASMFKTSPPVHTQENRASISSPSGRHNLGKQQNFYSEVEEFTKRKEKETKQAIIAKQDRMKKNAQHLVSIFKYGENNGYTVEECQFAVQQGNTTKEGVVQWLSNDLQMFINQFIKYCHENQETDNIGLINFKEAKKYLLQCKGDRKLAVNSFIKDRKEKVIKLSTDFKNSNLADITNALHETGGDVKEAEVALRYKLLDKFRARIYKKTEYSQIHNRLKNESIPDEVRIRMLIGQYDLTRGRAVVCMKLIKTGNFDIGDCIVAAKDNLFYHDCHRYLNHECENCFGRFPKNKLFVNVCCRSTQQCQVCYDCYEGHINYVLNNQHIRHLVCPVCQLPNLDGPLPPNYFDHLASFIRYLINIGSLDQQILETFETKLRDFSLTKDDKFRWCSDCGNGFLWENGEEQIKMTCDKCYSHHCFLCKEKWEDQHESITCDQFKAWKQANDPELQLTGVAQLLAINGMECPGCKFKYDLARGGCIHFTCSQCGYQFCIGCDKPFTATCHPAKGLHAHHPRNCFYFLRDLNVEEMQQLLNEDNVEFDMEIPEDKKEILELKCEIMEQKELDGGLIDQECGRDAPENMAGICELHYKEYLVAMINRHGVDPVGIMDFNAIKILYNREEKELPIKNEDETNANFLNRLRQVTPENIPLPEHKNRLQPAPILPANHDLDDIGNILEQQFLLYDDDFLPDVED